MLKPGQYADGLPLHELQYLCCKLVLRPNHFRSRRSLFDFARVLAEPCEKHGVTFAIGRFKDDPIQIREVLFIDTSDFRLYNNAFILRRRIRYEDGFPAGDPEIVFKFRHPNIQKAAETDVRPHILGDHQVKFKCQALPLKGELGGIRLLFSHNVQFPRSNLNETDVLSMGTMTRIFPVLEHLRKDPNEKVRLVSDTIIEEVLQDIGTLDFGQGIRAKANIGALADPRRAPSAHRRIRLSDQIQGPQTTGARRDEESRDVLHRPSIRGAGLDRAGRDENGHRVPASGQCAHVARVIMALPGARHAEALMRRFGLSHEHLVGIRFAINVALATTIVWHALQAIDDRNPIWAIASMVAASDPQPDEARRMFRCRLINVAVGSAVGLIFLVVGGAEDWTLPLALATTVLFSSYVVGIKTMWRQAPITAAVVIASAIATDSSAVGVMKALHKIAEVVFGSLVGIVVSLVMSKVWLIQPPVKQSRAA